MPPGGVTDGPSAGIPPTLSAARGWRVPASIYLGSGIGSPTTTSSRCVEDAERAQRNTAQVPLTSSPSEGGSLRFFGPRRAAAHLRTWDFPVLR